MTFPPSLHLLYFKIKSFLKMSSELTARTIVKNIASAIVFGSFSLGAYYFSRSTTYYLLDKAHLGVFLLHRFISMLLYVFFFSVNVGNIIVSYATLYRSQETAYLLTKPVSHVGLFVIKFLDNFFYSSTTLFLMATAVLLGYGSYFDLSWGFYLQTMVLLFIPFMVLSASVGVIALMLLMNLASKIGIKTVLAFVGTGYIGLVYSYFRVTSPLDLVNNVMRYYPNVDQYYGFLEPSLVRYLPNQWVADALYWRIQGNSYHVFGYTFILLDAVFLTLVAMVILAKKLYYSSWLTSLDLRARSEARGSSSGFLSFARRPMLEQQKSVLLKKEFWQFFREPGQWIHLVIISLLVFVFLASVPQIRIGSKSPFLQTVSYLVLYVFNAFLISSIALRFVYPMMSIEGRSFWSVLSAPVSREKIYFTKFVIAILPIFVVSLFLGIVSYRPLQSYGLLLDLAIESAFFTTLALVSLNLGAGTFFSDFSETNPIRIGSSQGATLTFLISLVYLIFLIGVMFLPLFGYFESMIRGTFFSTRIMYSGMVIVSLGSLLVTFVSSAVGLRSLRRDF